MLDLPVLSSVNVLERCLGHRIWQQQRQAQQGQHAAQANMPDNSPSIEDQESLQKEIETLCAQHQQMLTVIGCQATSISQMTAGTGDAGAREQEQLKILAMQAQELSALRSELEKHRKMS